MNAEKILKPKDLKVGMFVTVDNWIDVNDNSWKGDVIKVMGVSGKNFVGDLYERQGPDNALGARFTNKTFSLTKADFTQLTDEYVKAAGYVEPKPEPVKINYDWFNGIINPLSDTLWPILPFKVCTLGEFVSPETDEEQEITVDGVTYTAIEKEDCAGCAFEGIPCPEADVRICGPGVRKDGLSVIWKIKEKEEDENTFVKNGKTYEAMEQRGCTGCALISDNCDGPDGKLKCNIYCRRDGRSIIWKLKEEEEVCVHTFDGKTYVAEDTTGNLCIGCAFTYGEGQCMALKCSSRRKDKRNVIWVENVSLVEKIKRELDDQIMRAMAIPEHMMKPKAICPPLGYMIVTDEFKKMFPIKPLDAKVFFHTWRCAIFYMPWSDDLVYAVPTKYFDTMDTIKAAYGKDTNIEVK